MVEGTEGGKKSCQPLLRYRPFQDPNAYFIEQIKRDGHQNECHQIRGRDDSRHHHNDDEGMLAILRQQRRTDEAQLTQKEYNDRQLKHHTHNERQRDEGRHIRIERNIAVHPFRHAVGAKEPERDGEQHEIGHHHAQKE